VDCADHTALANFYRQAIGAEVTRTTEDSSWLQGPRRLTIFRTVPDFVPPTWPAPDRPIQAHADYWVDDLETAHRELEKLGATTPDYQPERPNGLIVMLDPAGHPFCIAVRPAEHPTG
jgi:hypothetical protein